MQARARTHRLLAGLLTIVTLLGGLLGEGVHRIAEPHTWCPVHEALEHGAQEELAHGDIDRAVPRRTVVDHLEADTSTEEHETCHLPVLSNDEETLFRASRDRASLCSAQDRCGMPIERRSPPSIPRFRLAPKQSPPGV